MDENNLKILIIEEVTPIFIKNLKNKIIKLNLKYKINITQQLSYGFDMKEYKKEYEMNNVKNNLFSLIKTFM